MARKSMTELLADLLTSFPDNSTGLITPLVLRNYFTSFINAIRPAYATLERQVGVSQPNVPVTDTPLIFTSGDASSSNGEMTVNAAIGQVGRVDKGSTAFEFTADILSASNSVRTLTFTLYEGNTPTVWAQSVVLSTNTQVESVSFSMLVYSPTAVNYSMRVRSSVIESYTFSNMTLIASIEPVNSY